MSGCGSIPTKQFDIQGVVVDDQGSQLQNFTAQVYASKSNAMKLLLNPDTYSPPVIQSQAAVNGSTFPITSKAATHLEINLS